MLFRSLNAGKPVTVVDETGDAVGIVHASRVVSILFGGHADHAAERA